jgi:hypothetical protein
MNRMELNTSMDTGPINPLAGALASTGHVQSTSATDRARRLARDRAAVREQSVDPSTQQRQVEDSTEIDAINADEDPGPFKKKRPPHRRADAGDDEHPSIDVTA